MDPTLEYRIIPQRKEARARFVAALEASGLRRCKGIPRHFCQAAHWRSKPTIVYGLNPHDRHRCGAIVQRCFRNREFCCSHDLVQPLSREEIDSNPALADAFALLVATDPKPSNSNAVFRPTIPSENTFTTTPSSQSSRNWTPSRSSSLTPLRIYPRKRRHRSSSPPTSPLHPFNKSPGRVGQSPSSPAYKRRKILPAIRRASSLNALSGATRFSSPPFRCLSDSLVAISSRIDNVIEVSDDELEDSSGNQSDFSHASSHQGPVPRKHVVKVWTNDHESKSILVDEVARGFVCLASVPGRSVLKMLEIDIDTEVERHDGANVWTPCKWDTYHLVEPIELIELRYAGLEVTGHLGSL